MGSFSDVFYICGVVENIKTCLNVSHLRSSTGDGSVFNLYAWENMQIEDSVGFGNSFLYHLHIHISGIESAAIGEIRYLPICESDFYVEFIIKDLKIMDCSGRILRVRP